MNRIFLSLLFCSCTALVARAGDPEAACRTLTERLQAELQVLNTVQNAATAEQALPALESALAELAQQPTAATEAELWRYIDNTPERKNRIIEQLQQLALIFNRLEKEKFYGNARLRSLLRPQLKR